MDFERDVMIAIAIALKLERWHALLQIVATLPRSTFVRWPKFILSLIIRRAPLNVLHFALNHYYCTYGFYNLVKLCRQVIEQCAQNDDIECAMSREDDAQSRTPRQYYYIEHRDSAPLCDYYNLIRYVLRNHAPRINFIVNRGRNEFLKQIWYARHPVQPGALALNIAHINVEDAIHGTIDPAILCDIAPSDAQFAQCCAFLSKATKKYFARNAMQPLLAKMVMIDLYEVAKSTILINNRAMIRAYIREVSCARIDALCHLVEVGTPVADVLYFARHVPDPAHVDIAPILDAIRRVDIPAHCEYFCTEVTRIFSRKEYGTICI